MYIFHVSLICSCTSCILGKSKVMNESCNIPERRCHLFQRADIPINDDYILFIYYAIFAKPTLPS